MGVKEVLTHKTWLSVEAALVLEIVHCAVTKTGMDDKMAKAIAVKSFKLCIIRLFYILYMYL
jgi:hypothetical protein